MDEFEKQREEMLRTIEALARETASLVGRSEFATEVMTAMARVPRHEFVPSEERFSAYANAARPIGCGQTISQPFIVALMTDLAELTPESVVLEVGTGCGYQTAVLAEIADRVYSIEVVPELAMAARERLERLGCTGIEIRQGDGSRGWKEHAPYDAILVTAAARRVPDALLAQLAPEGRLVIPIGAPGNLQQLVVVHRDASGRTRERAVLPVAFVPLVDG